MHARCQVAHGAQSTELHGWPNDFVGMESHVCSVKQFSKNATVSYKCVMLMCHANVNVSYYATHKQSVWTLQPLFSGIHLLATA